MNDGDGGDSKDFGLFGESLILRASLQQGERAENNQRDDRKEEKREEPALARLGLIFDFRCHKDCTFPSKQIMP